MPWLAALCAILLVLNAMGEGGNQYAVRRRLRQRPPSRLPLCSTGCEAPFSRTDSYAQHGDATATQTRSESPMEAVEPPDVIVRLTGLWVKRRKRG